VVREHARGDVAQARVLADPRPDLRVARHLVPLRVGQRAGLVQDRVGDPELAEVVQHAGGLQAVDARGRQAEPQLGRLAARRPRTRDEHPLDRRRRVVRDRHQHADLVVGRPVSGERLVDGDHAQHLAGHAAQWQQQHVLRVPCLRAERAGALGVSTFGSRASSQS